MNHFEKVKNYLLELGYDIVKEDASEELVVIEDEEYGLKNVIVDCEDPILIIEMFILDLKESENNGRFFKDLLMKNRAAVHGAFCIDEEGKRLLFRETLELENLDLNELEGSLNALKLLISETFEELIGYAKA